MSKAITVLGLLTAAAASPIPQPALTDILPAATGQIVPDLPMQADLAMAQTYVNTAVTKYSGTYNSNKDIYGEMINSYIPLSDTADAVIGADNVLAIDVLADRACIAAADQGSLCNELLAYAYAFYAIQLQGKTGRELATILGVSVIITPLTLLLPST
jgi:hypothetical protein